MSWGGSKLAKYRAAVLDAYGDVCMLCGKPGATTIDHIIPRSKAPELTWVLDNMRMACASCNSRRGNMSVREYHARYPRDTYSTTQSRRW